MPKSTGAVARDREITRAIHRLFWKGNFANRGTFITWLFMRPPALFIYNVLIPIQVAYGLQAIIQQRFDSVLYYAATIVVFAIAYCVLWAAGGWAICKNGAVGGAYVQKAVFSNYLQKDYEFYNATYLGTLSAQAVRLREAFNEYNQIVINAVPAQAVVVVSSIAIIAYHSLLLAGVALGCMLLVLSFTVASARWRLRYRRILGEANGMLAGVIGDALGQGTTVKSFAAEAHEERRLSTAVGKWSDAQYHSWLSSIPSDVGRMALAAATTGALLLLTAHLYQRHAISIAIVALVQLYVVKLISTTQDIADTIKTYETMIGGAYQSIKIMMIPPTVTDAASPKRLPEHTERTIAFKDVSFRYGEARSRVKAVDEFGLVIRPGEKIGLVGYSGSGKTTLTKLLVRFMDVTAGSITIDGIDIRDVAQTELRKCIAYVPQEPLLFHRSISENIGYGKPEAPKKTVLEAAHAAYVSEFVDELPQGYETLVGERGVKLSGGQRQRVAIARALLKDAPILVLDEATSALDSRSEKLIQEALWKLMEGRTAIVVAHRLSTIQRMDRIVVMNKGKIVQIGTHEELLQDERSIYAELWAHQSGGYVGVPATPSTDDPLAEPELALAAS